MYYIGFKGRSRDVRVGLHHGATCAGCCWGLMILCQRRLNSDPARSTGARNVGESTIFR
jgi:hypothetical protein